MNVDQNKRRSVIEVLGRFLRDLVGRVVGSITYSSI